MAAELRSALEALSHASAVVVSAAIDGTSELQRKVGRGA
jgi:hypothetical protein